MTYPVVEYVNAAAGTTDFDVPFPFLSNRHVEVLVNDAIAYILEWIGDRRLRLSAPVSPTDVVTIQRNTPVETALVQFHDGAVLTQEDLNTAVQQLLYKQQELQALYDGTLKRARIRLGEANGIITNPEDVVQELANLVLEDEVLSMFRQRIADIDITAALLHGQADEITGIITDIAEQTTDTLALRDTLQALAGDLTALQGVVDGLLDLENGSGIATLIKNEKDERVAGDVALAATIALIGAKSNGSSAFLLDLNNVRVSPTESLAQRLLAIKSFVDGNAAAIQAEQSARSDAVSAEAAARETLGATLRGEQSAAIIAEQQARASAISAEATARNTLAATIRGEYAAAVQQEALARVEQDGALSGLIALLGVRSDNGTSFILADNRVQLSSGQSLASRLSGLDSSLGGLSASITAVDTARVQGQNSLAESIGLVRTDVNGLSASVGTLSQSIDGVKARYGVSLDVNGHVTGFVQNNDGREGSFVILADRFAIVAPGANPTVPFEVSQGEVWVNGQRLRPGSVDADRLRVTHLSALTADIGFLVSYNGLGGRVERDGNGTRIFGNNGVLRIKMGF